MSRLYEEPHRAFQDHFGTRGIADRVEDVAMATEITPEAKAFIESRDMFFLTTIDPKGRPTVSYKGGPTGFVKVLDDQTLAFPSYDGNGMYYSMGNIDRCAEIGMLFIDFETPHRIRLQGRGSVCATDPLLSEWQEAELVVRVGLHELWQNCPRYIHRYKQIKQSRYVPAADRETPVAGWKRIDGMQDVLRPHERAAVEQEGEITLDEWAEKIVTGDEKA